MIAIASAVDIAISAPWPRAGLSMRVLHHAWDLSLTIAVGLVIAIAANIVWSLFRRPRWALALLYAVVAIASLQIVIGSDLRRQADFLTNGKLATAANIAFVIGAGLALPIAHKLGAVAAKRPAGRWIFGVAALSAITAQHFMLRDDYPGLHAAIAWGGAILGAPTFARALDRARRHRVVRAFSLALAAVSLVPFAFEPSNRVRVALFQQPGAMGAWAFAAWRWRAPLSDVPAVEAPIATMRGAEPSAERLVDGPPIVVMITVDAMRADVVLDGAGSAELPFFTELMRGGAAFTRASSGGSQTSVSLSTLFSGRYFSQLFWAPHGVGKMRFLYPASDPAERFPEILQRAGVRTRLFGGVAFLAPESGVARGFDEVDVPSGRRHEMGRDVIEPMIRALQNAGDRPTFLYAHLMEPHAPYDRGKRKTGTPFERYVSEVEAADALVAKVARVLAQRYPTRGVLIVSADHGEAFGEHGTTEHTKTLYEELVHVPLLVRASHVVARRIDARVGLADLGPTILDVFGIATPPGWVGGSLVPLLAGRDAAPDRPVMAEGRLRRAIYAGDLKVIEDLRCKKIEAYDLANDPGEAVNLFDEAPETAAPALAALRGFFAAHAAKRPGYEPPYKP